MSVSTIRLEPYTIRPPAPNILMEFSVGTGRIVDRLRQRLDRNVGDQVAAVAIGVKPVAVGDQIARRGRAVPAAASKGFAQAALLHAVVLVRDAP